MKFFRDLPELKSVVFMQQSANNTAFLVLSRGFLDSQSIDLPQLKKIGMEVTKEVNGPFPNLQSVIVNSVNEECCQTINQFKEKVYFVPVELRVC